MIVKHVHIQTQIVLVYPVWARPPPSSRLDLQRQMSSGGLQLDQGVGAHLPALLLHLLARSALDWFSFGGLACHRPLLCRQHPAGQPDGRPDDRRVGDRAGAELVHVDIDRGHHGRLAK